ncbi:hypothetical protein BVX94_01685, partial [bacterium B17]
LVEGPYKLRISHPEKIVLNESARIAPGENKPMTIVMRSGLQIAGKVLEADGTPASKAIVVISGPIGARNSKGMNRTTETDSNGMFTQSGLTMGKYNVAIQNSRTKEQEKVVRNVFAGTMNMAIKLQKKCLIQGTVKVSSGNPLKDVDISYRKITVGKKTAMGAKAITVTTTDAEGKFNLLLKFGKKYEIKANRHPLLPGLATLMLPEKAGEQTKSITIVMESGETINGTIVSEKGSKPMKGLCVRTTPNAGLGFMLKDELADDVVPTGDDGRFSIKGLRAGVAKLTVTLADNPRWILATKQVLIKEGASQDVTITIKETGSVKGSIDLTAFDGKTPRVSLHSRENPQQNFTAEVNDKGLFTVDNIPPGDYMATAIAPMGPSLTPGPTGSRRRPTPLNAMVTVKSAQTAEVKIKKMAETVGKTFRLEGTVMKQGKPFGEGAIEFASTKPSGSPGKGMMMFRVGKNSKIDENSKYAIEKMEAGEFVFVVRPGLKGKPKKSLFQQKSYSGVVKVENNQKELVINIDGSTLEGVVRNKEKFPAKAVNVIVGPENVDGIMKRRLTRRCQTGADGKYTLDCIPPGSYSVNVRSRDGSSSASKRNLKLSRKLHNLDLLLQDNCKIHGNVSIPGMKKLRGVSTVAVSSEDYSIPGYGTVDENGKYTITPDLPPGEYIVFSFKDGYTVSESKVDLKKDTQVDATLEPAGKINVTLKSASAKDIVGRIVRVKSADGKEIIRCRKPSQWTRSGGPWSRLLIAPTDETGNTVIEGLKEGKYIISIDGSDKTTSCEVKPLEETAAEIDI